MALTRRQFLTVVGGGALGAVVAAACGVPEDELFVQSPPGMPEDMVTGLDNFAELKRDRLPPDLEAYKQRYGNGG